MSCHASVLHISFEVLLNLKQLVRGSKGQVDWCNAMLQTGIDGLLRLEISVPMDD